MRANSKTSPSVTFLFDKSRSGRLRFGKGKMGPFELVWRCRLPSYPPRAPESTPAFDDEGNLYFGSHDCCFYSVDRDGKLRWMYKVGNQKVYSSPAISEGKVVVASGDGRLFCFALDGQLQWIYDICDLAYFENKRRHKNGIL